MNGTFRQQIDRWLLGLTRASVQGGAAAVKAFFGAAGANAIGLPVPSLTALQVGAVFLFGLGWHFFDYLASNPIPDVPAPAAPVSAVQSPKTDTKG